MIVKTLEALKGTAGDAKGPGWSSRRLLLAEDDVGFTMTESIIEAGVDHVLWYKHHIEACYCVEGEGEVEELPSGNRHRIAPGTCYALDKYDRHRFRAFTDMRLVCVFVPALAGGEVHDAHGAYAPAGAT